ncbi:hypothetical protein [Gaoshiqia sediminis]|uniref:Uncharacterized protein n=1 Tax=Gaoshiqia sediminis TaxID=2986998 RepID=A0AA41Y733_9BACT|nr:hypothetical protein [Gaoshiqia sediminis]MCW0482317.1 hypothetical protein [Gaoshiqia sediminis]
MKENWNKISLAFLFIVAIIGTLLRSPYVSTLPLEYTNLVHAHSHTAFQGWIYTIIFLILTSTFIGKDKIEKGHYRLQFKLTVLIVLGVLISFTLQGYGLYSIVFSTLFQVLNYWFIYRFLKDSCTAKPNSANYIVLRFIKAGLWLGVLSTIMPFGIGFLSANGQSGTELYHAFVYTFMHLQYNGWFLFVALGLFYKLLERNNIDFSSIQANRFFWFFTVSIIPAITLSLLGMSFSKYLMLPAYFSVFLQLLGLFFFLLSLPRKTASLLRYKSEWLRLYLLVFLASIFLKNILQILSVFTTFQAYAFNNKLIILAYLHLTLIGVISFLFFALMIDMKWIVVDAFVKLGNSLLFLGFATTELILTLGGLGLYYSHQILLTGSISMTLGILILVISRKNRIAHNSYIQL